MAKEEEFSDTEIVGKINNEVYNLVDGVPITHEDNVKTLDLVGRIEDLKKKLPSKFHEHLNAFSRRNSTDMSVRIFVEFPLKQVADFIVLKQIKVSFREASGKNNPYTLYIQYNLRNGMRTELVTRNIWAKEGKFLTEKDTNLSPEIRKIADTLAELFGMHGSKVTDMMFPF